MDTTKPWGLLPEIDPDPHAPMCGEVNGRIICCRSTGHRGRHATPFPSRHRHGPVWVFWGGPPLGPFGTCHASDPVTHLYCGLETGHEGDHLAPSNAGGGATLAEWIDPFSAGRAVVATPMTATLTVRQGWAGKDSVPVEVREIRIGPAPASTTPPDPSTFEAVEAAQAAFLGISVESLRERLAASTTDSAAHVEDVWGEPVEGGRFYEHTHGPGRACDYDCGGAWVDTWPCAVCGKPIPYGPGAMHLGCAGASTTDARHEHRWKLTPSLSWACGTCGEPAPEIAPGCGDPIRVACPSCGAPGFTRAELTLHRCAPPGTTKGGA